MKWALNWTFSLNVTFEVDVVIGVEINCLPRGRVLCYSVCSMCAGPQFSLIPSTIITIKWKYKTIKLLEMPTMPPGENPSLAFQEASCRKHVQHVCVLKSSLWLHFGLWGLSLLLHYNLLWLWKCSHGGTKIWYMNLLEMPDNQLLEFHLSMPVVSGT